MKNKKYALNLLLTAVLGIALLAALPIRTLLPRFILPQLDVPNLVLLSLLALTLEHYVAPQGKRCWLCVILLGGVTFGLLPLAACFVGGMDALKLALLGGVSFAVVTWLFDQMTVRLSTGPVAKIAPIAGAVCLYLAAQALM